MVDGYITARDLFEVIDQLEAPPTEKEYQHTVREFAKSLQYLACARQDLRYGVIPLETMQAIKSHCEAIQAELDKFDRRRRHLQI